MNPSRALLFIPVLMLVLASVALQASGNFKYSYVPKKVYENQIFPVTILEVGSSGEKPVFRFENDSDAKALFKKPLSVKNGDDSFYTFYFKAGDKNFHLPSLSIESGGESFYLEGLEIPLAKLERRADFCGVVAADMKIETSQASTFDEKYNLVTLSIKAFEANLEDMHLSNVLEDGVENIVRKNAKVTSEYYAVVDSNLSKLRFTYFNTIKGQFVFLEAPITIVDYSVSTQMELNPRDDSFNEIKKTAFIGVSILFFLLFLWKRDFFYLIIAVLSTITLLTFFMPGKKICVQQGAPLFILPTYNSNISTTIERRFEAPQLGKREQFNKIEYKKGVVGWVKDEDLCKN